MQNLDFQGGTTRRREQCVLGPDLGGVDQRGWLCVLGSRGVVLGYLLQDTLRIVCTQLARAPRILAEANRLSPLDIVSRYAHRTPRTYLRMGDMVHSRLCRKDLV